MNNTTAILLCLAIITCLGLASSRPLPSGTNNKTVFVGCTPGDDPIKSSLGIPKQTIIDFIKWDLEFENLNHNTFVLDILYGEAQPNTLDFKHGGQKRSYQGQYRLSKENGYEIYYLKSNGLQAEIALIRLNANILHLLTSQKKLMVGNGGWSYTLNNKTPDKNNYALPTLSHARDILTDTAKQITYDGRTPCQDFAIENNLTVNESCFKLKWKLILSKDSRTLQPTTYALKRTNSRESDLTGSWTIIQGISSNQNAIIVQLDPDKPNQSVSLLVGDDNVLFFLRKDKNLFVGNENFSFTLNKRQNPTK